MFLFQEKSNISNFFIIVIYFVRGVVWRGVAWCGVVWRGVAWFGGGDVEVGALWWFGMVVTRRVRKVHFFFAWWCFATFPKGNDLRLPKWCDSPAVGWWCFLASCVWIVMLSRPPFLSGGVVPSPSFRWRCFPSLSLVCSFCWWCCFLSLLWVVLLSRSPLSGRFCFSHLSLVWSCLGLLSGAVLFMAPSYWVVLLQWYASQCFFCPFSLTSVKWHCHFLSISSEAVELKNTMFYVLNCNF